MVKDKDFSSMTIKVELINWKISLDITIVHFESCITNKLERCSWGVENVDEESLFFLSHTKQGANFYRFSNSKLLILIISYQEVIAISVYIDYLFMRNNIAVFIEDNELRII